ncbi:MAG: ParB/RepB/Spo0J family partition protein [Actinobacteria bacterium]|nr:MAG: ParB/RepB/Spo0J family partition protein [Actinomycetota bacterium]
MSKGGLGRGLAALIPTASADEGEPQSLPLGMISPNPAQPRTDIEDEKITELADSVGKHGVLQAILVRPLGEGYQIVAGERRWRAAREAGLESIPVRIVNLTEAEALEVALIENLQREDLNAIEEARGYKRLIGEYQMTQAELADKVSKSRSAIANALRLLDLPEEVQEMVYDGRLSAGHARAVLSVPDDARRISMAQKVADRGLSVREAESLARLLAAGQAERAPRAPQPKSFKVVARQLRKVLGTAVRVRQNDKKGKIEIDFHGEEDLERLFSLLTSPGGSTGGDVS